MVCEGRMRRRWSYFKWVLRRNRPIILGIAALIVVVRMLLGNQDAVAEKIEGLYFRYGVHAAHAVMERWLPNGHSDDTEFGSSLFSKPEVLKYLDRIPGNYEQGEDPAYEKMLAGVWEAEIRRENQKVEEQIQIETSGSSIIREKFADYDYLMKEFYIVHHNRRFDLDQCRNIFKDGPFD